MSDPFVLPQGMKGRFGVVKLWPKLKTAEDENIARLKRTARSMGLECVEIDDQGRSVEQASRQMTQDDLDFVIHLHFQTPKAYDIFSFVALWNPLQFYHEWGYERFSRNLLTHDDFLSCDSPAADDMVKRMILADPTRAAPEFHMFHSLSDPVFEPTLGDGKLYYVGINWERLGQGRSRHQEILKALDDTGDLRLYGPKIFHGVRVWEGYKSYVDELPFDGASSIAAINKAGIVLVLSSKAHKESALMSNRLFEAAAAGALAICDENPFAKKHFGDSVLYIDTSLPSDQVVRQIRDHLAWIKSHPQDALNLAQRAQAIFNEKFRLNISLAEIYAGFQNRKQELRRLYAPIKTDRQATLYLLLPDFDKEILQRHIRSFQTQNYPSCRAVLVVDEYDLAKHDDEITATIKEKNAAITLSPCPFYKRNGVGKILFRLPRGKILADVLREDALLETGSYYCFVAPNETLFSHHIEGLVAALEAEPARAYAASQALLRHTSADGETHHDVSENLYLTRYVANNPSGYARLLFRHGDHNAREREIVLPYLDIMAPLGLTKLEESALSPRATVIARIQDKFCNATHVVLREEKILRDQNPAVFDKLRYREPAQIAAGSSIGQIFIDMARAFPMPDFVRNALRVPWRFFLRFYRRYQRQAAK